MAQRQSPQKRHWVFTSYLDILAPDFDKNHVRYCCFQREVCPESKRQHWQGYIEFFNGVRVGQVKAVLGECHLEPRKGSRDEARDYCRKAESAVAGSFREFGLWREDVSHKRKLCDMLKSDMTLDALIDYSPIDYVRYHRGLEKLYQRRIKKAARVFRSIKVVVLVGKTGSGKTRRATMGDDWFIIPCSNQIWFDGYDGEKTLIIDDFYGNIKYALFLRVLDGHAIQLPVKGSFIWGRWTKVIITSNVYPEKWYKMGFTEALQRRITDIITMDGLEDMMCLESD